jgi:protein involved in polysaccharide export with SLBB domain
MLKSIQLAALSLCFIILSVATQAAAPVLSEPYRLGPDDKLRVRVYEWRDMYGQVHQDWAALNDEFTVGPNGELSLPLVGSVAAAGQTIEAVTAAIADRLQITAGMETRPKISVEVAKYRPFYILGEVNKPGEYPYRPGLTALQALGIAGGVFRPLQAAMLELDATGTGTAGITSRRLTRDVLEKQITTLQEKIASVDQEFGMLNGQLAGERELVKKGWSSTSRVIPMEQGVMKLQRDRLDLDVSLARAKEELAKQSGVEPQNQDRQELLHDSEDTNVQLTQHSTKIGIADQSTTPEARARNPVLSRSTDEDSIVYTIVRHETAGEHELVGSDGTLIQPGDTIKVKRQVPTPIISDRTTMPSKSTQDGAPAIARATPVKH